MPSPGSTPGVWVKGAGSGAQFSPECEEAMAKCDVDPDDFGTYEETMKRSRRARAKVDAWEAANEQGRPNAVPQPSQAEQAIAKTKGAHLVQNAVYQRSRDKVHTNEVDGYQLAKAPTCAMDQPQNGWDPNLETDDGFHTFYEQAALEEAREAHQPGMKGNQDARYPQGRRTGDEDERALRYCTRKKRAKADREKQATASPPGAARGGRSRQKGPDAAGVETGDDAFDDESRPELTNPDPDAAKAAECISTWRKNTVSAMEDDCVAEYDRAREIESMSDEQAEAARRGLAGKVDQAETDVKVATARRDRARNDPHGDPMELRRSHEVHAEALNRQEQTRSELRKFDSIREGRGTDRAWSQQSARLRSERGLPTEAPAALPRREGRAPAPNVPGAGNRPRRG